VLEAERLLDLSPGLAVGVGPHPQGLDDKQGQHGGFNDAKHENTLSVDDLSL